MAGQRILDPFIGVRIPAPEPIQRAIGGAIVFIKVSNVPPRHARPRPDGQRGQLLAVGDTTAARIASTP